MLQECSFEIFPKAFLKSPSSDLSSLAEQMLKIKELGLFIKSFSPESYPRFPLMQHAVDGCLSMAHGKTHVLDRSGELWDNAAGTDSKCHLCSAERFFLQMVVAGGSHPFPQDVLWYQDFSCYRQLLSLVKQLPSFASGALTLGHPMVSSQIPHYIHPCPILALLLAPLAATRHSAHGWIQHHSQEASTDTQPEAMPSQPSLPSFRRCLHMEEAILQEHWPLHAAHRIMTSPKVVPKPCVAFSSPGGHRIAVGELCLGTGDIIFHRGKATPPNHAPYFRKPQCTFGMGQPARLAATHPFPVLCCHQVDV